MRKLSAAVVRSAAALIAVAALVLGTTATADAAGLVTHAWMAEAAIPGTSDPALRSLLLAHADQVRAGAEFPDGGYLSERLDIPGGDYGEEAHWQRFVDAYLDVVRARQGCGDLTDPAGPCAAEVAHLFGVAAHGMGDEVWDWLFEPNAPDRGEEFIPPELASILGPGGIEVQMDVIAVVDHGRPTGATPPIPDEADVLAAFAAVGRPDITTDAIAVGEIGLDGLRSAEGAIGPLYADRIRAAMPWTSANFVTAAGGVEFAGRAIAAYWDDLWLRLLDQPTATRVGATAPFEGQTEVPHTGWVRPYRPGSVPDGGGASTRIVAYLTHSLPYVASATDRTSLPTALPPTAMRLTERDTGAVVVPMAGYPAIVPYDPDYGEHGVALQPATDLRPCTWYRVEVTADLVDADGESVLPAAWAFQTSCAVPVAAAPAPGPGAAVPIVATPRFTG